MYLTVELESGVPTARNDGTDQVDYSYPERAVTYLVSGNSRFHSAQVVIERVWIPVRT